MIFVLKMSPFYVAKCRKQIDILVETYLSTFCVVTMHWILISALLVKAVSLLIQTKCSGLDFIRKTFILVFSVIA